LTIFLTNASLITETVVKTSVGCVAASQAINLLRQMLLLRRFDERLVALQKEGLLPGHTSPYVGQEAIAIGVAAELSHGDIVGSHHRPTGHALAAGLDPGPLMAELLGRSIGYCKGIAGKHLVSSLKHGFLGANGVVGGGIPLAIGAALAQRMQRTSGVTVAYFGDGATNTGAFHESLNLAAVWSLPVLFICENNGYAFSTRQQDHQRVHDVSDRAAAYGMPGEHGDGNDIEVVRAAVRPAVARARMGAGPTLFDFKTYRHYGQYDADDSLSYRSQEEIDSWKQRCPIEGYRRRLTDRSELTDEVFAALSRDVETAIARAEDQARAAPRTQPSEAARYVYAESDLR
jgi:acetoin:2,6-dichlorophenolindophenol oxidoreductase subunit alpha